MFLQLYMSRRPNVMRLTVLVLNRRLLVPVFIDHGQCSILGMEC